MMRREWFLASGPARVPLLGRRVHSFNFKKKKKTSSVIGAFIALLQDGIFRRWGSDFPWLRIEEVRLCEKSPKVGPILRGRIG